MPGGTKTISELIAERNAIERQIVARIKSVEVGQRRPCGCSSRGRHRPSCKVRSINPLHPWDGEKMRCCGSRNAARHKAGCQLSAKDGKLPPDARWDCVKCGAYQFGERPEKCGICGEVTMTQRIV